MSIEERLASLYELFNNLPMTEEQLELLENHFEQYRREQEQKESCTRRTCNYITDYIKDVLYNFRPYPFIEVEKEKNL